jgi:hypothetical protein
MTQLSTSTFERDCWFFVYTSSTTVLPAPS